MSKDIEKVNALREGILTKEQIDTLAKASIIPADTPAPVVAVFAATCAAHGLSPYKREIYLVKYGTQYNTIVGIDGLRAKAARTGQFAGKDDAQFNRTADGSYLTAYDVLKKGSKEFPDTCTITIYRVIGAHRVPFTKTVLWREYAPARLGGKWQAMPFNMLEKCAEAAALRMAFADETAGLHIEEEKEAFQGTTVQDAPHSTPDPEAEKVAELKKQVRAILSGCEKTTEVGQIATTLKEKDAAGTLTAQDLENALEALKIACK
jgi:phage recombination protein Bet